MQRETELVEIGTQLSVTHASFNRDRLRLSIQTDDFILRPERKKLASGIGNLVEAMPRAQNFELIVRIHKSLNIFVRGRRVQALRAVLEISSPVGELVLRRPREGTREKRARRRGRSELHEGSFVQGSGPVRATAAKRGWQSGTTYIEHQQESRRSRSRGHEMGRTGTNVFRQLGSQGAAD